MTATSYLASSPPIQPHTLGPPLQCQLLDPRELTWSLFKGLQWDANCLEDINSFRKAAGLLQSGLTSTRELGTASVMLYDLPYDCKFLKDRDAPLVSPSTEPGPVTSTQPRFKKYFAVLMNDIGKLSFGMWENSEYLHITYAMFKAELVSPQWPSPPQEGEWQR